jgi:NADPH2:quinone reductase
LSFEQLPDPQPGPNQVLIRVRAIGVNPVETYLRSGSNPALALPYTPGTDVAGEVLAVGDAVRGWPPGARVYSSGTVTGAYAGMALCEAADVHRLPERISFAQGAAVNIPGATAWRALIQLARAAGLTIIATAGTPAGGELVRQLGAHHVLDHRDPAYLQQIAAITDGRGPDIILEMLANVNLAKDLSMLAFNGRVIVIGNRGKIEIDPREAMKRDAEIRGMMLFNISAKEKLAIHRALGAALENGVLNPVINCQLPLAQAARAHEQILQPGARGKIILIPDA